MVILITGIRERLQIKLVHYIKEKHKQFHFYGSFMKTLKMK